MPYPLQCPSQTVCACTPRAKCIYNKPPALRAAAMAISNSLSRLSDTIAAIVSPQKTGPRGPVVVKIGKTELSVAFGRVAERQRSNVGCNAGIARR